MLFFVVCLVEIFCPEISLSSKKQETNISELISKRLALLTKLDLDGCNVTDQGADLITEVLLKTASLKVLSIANAKLNTILTIKIFTALKIFLLQILKLNNNNIDGKAADSIATVISNNHLLVQLNISHNKFSASGLSPVIQALSVSKSIKLLDISGNFKNYGFSDEIEYISTTLAKYLALQVLNISNNSLTFTNVLKIAQAFRSHPSLEILNISNNITSHFMECEFLMDIILSVNHLLANINVCGRNIRPRFNNDCLFFPLNCHKSPSRFILQNLYFSQYDLFNRRTKVISASTQGQSAFEGKCSSSSENVVSYYVDQNGGTFYNQDHNFAIVIPPDAVSQGDYVQIQATASRFSEYRLPNGCYPISSYFWISACYTFKIPVFLIMGHCAKIRNLEDIDNLCVLHTCDHDVTSEEELVMEEVSNGVYFDYDINYCVFATDHFCSICLGKKNICIPGKFLAFLYVHNTNEEQFADVCFCLATCDCAEVCTLLRLWYGYLIILGDLLYKGISYLHWVYSLLAAFVPLLT